MEYQLCLYCGGEVPLSRMTGLPLFHLCATPDVALAKLTLIGLREQAVPAALLPSPQKGADSQEQAI